MFPRRCACFLVVCILFAFCACQSEKPAPGPAPMEKAAETISDFKTKVELADTDPKTGRIGRVRFISIKYTGKKLLENGTIKYSIQFTDRRKSEGSEKFDTWEPGERKYITFATSLGVQYRWSGDATCEGKKVQLEGFEGSHE